MWQVSRDDIDRVMADLSDGGLAASTRSGYLQIFKGFYAFVEARHGVEVEQRFGVVMVNPVDAFNSPVHVGSGLEASRPPPTPQRLEDFFAYSREQIATARKYGTAARDYTLFRTLYHAGLRSDEAARLDVTNVHLDRGPFGKLHVRFGKGTRTSGPRARWVPLLDGLDLILGWYLAEIRPRFGTGPALFCDEGGGAIHRGTVGNRLRAALVGEQAGAEGHFSPHGLRHACATHNYERGVDLVAIQQLLGHWQIGTTMRYVTRRRRSSRTPIGGHCRQTLPNSREAIEMDVTWRLRMAAAQREVWTGAALRRLLAERAGVDLSPASVSALLTGQPRQLKLSTLAALCTALECGPADLIEVDTTPVVQAARRGRAKRPESSPRQGRTMPPL